MFTIRACETFGVITLRFPPPNETEAAFEVVAALADEVAVADVEDIPTEDAFDW